MGLEIWVEFDHRRRMFPVEPISASVYISLYIGLDIYPDGCNYAGSYFSHVSCQVPFFCSGLAHQPLELFYIPVVRRPSTAPSPVAEPLLLFNQ